MLSPNDTTRVARALEVIRSTGHSLAFWQQRMEGGIADQITLSPLVLLPDRDELFTRCDTRFARMLDSGAVDEVEALLARHLNPDLPVMRAIGVPEVAGWLRGEWPREDALARGQQATRNYAKRQFTWFRNQPPAEWPQTSAQDCDIAALFETLLPSIGLT
jgi:tRNA dimethylallyltransferase